MSLQKIKIVGVLALAILFTLTFSVLGNNSSEVEIITNFDEYDEWVSTVDFSSDGSMVVSGDRNKLVKVWETNTGKVLTEFKGHEGIITSAKFSSDDSMVVSGSTDGTVKVWEVKTGALITTFEKHESRVLTVDFSPDNKKIVSGSKDRTIKIWEVETGKVILNFDQHFGEISNESINSLEMVLVEAGTASSDNYGSITVDNDFYIGKYHVTQAKYEEVMGYNPSYFNDDDHPNLKGSTEDRPVERVSWYDAILFCNKLSEVENLEKYYNISNIEYDYSSYVSKSIIDAIVTENKGANGYRLPTKNEHQYAARGGKNGSATVYAGSNHLDEVGWSSYNSDVAKSEINERYTDMGTMPVGMKKANELGLYDMSGNLNDWTNSKHSGDSYYIYGGSWKQQPMECDLDKYNYYNKSDTSWSYHIGFRLVRSL